MQDTLTGNYGLYSVAEERWVCEPVYSDIYQTKDGYGLGTCGMGGVGEIGGMALHLRLCG